MTFSLVALSEDGHFLGVAVASKFLAVGAVVPGAVPGSGAVATQSLANLRYVPDGLALMAQGESAQTALATLVAADTERESRQAGLVDARGGSASFTGDDCFAWAGGTTGPGWAAQGNILTGPEVIDDMVAAYQASDPSHPLAHRLVTALLAGDRAGGDSRGRQSAAVLVVTPGGGYGGGNDILVDLRVDDHEDPVPELQRLLLLHDLLFTRPDPADCLPIGSVAPELRALLDALGHTNVDLGHALSDFAGVENLEERMVLDRIDPVVLDHLRDLVARRGGTP